jgi:hypothetical protein
MIPGEAHEKRHKDTDNFLVRVWTAKHLKW